MHVCVLRHMVFGTYRIEVGNQVYMFYAFWDMVWEFHLKNPLV